jgi:hypothetical protein
MGSGLVSPRLLVRSPYTISVRKISSTSYAWSAQREALNGGRMDRCWLVGAEVPVRTGLFVTPPVAHRVVGSLVLPRRRRAALRADNSRCAVHPPPLRPLVGRVDRLADGALICACSAFRSRYGLGYLASVLS